MRSTEALTPKNLLTRIICNRHTIKAHVTSVLCVFVSFVSSELRLDAESTNPDTKETWGGGGAAE